MAANLGTAGVTSPFIVSTRGEKSSTRRSSVRFLRTLRSSPTSRYRASFGLRNPVISMAASAETVNEVLPPSLDSTAEPPALFDGTSRLYISYICPYAQRTWIARNYKGLQEKIRLVPIDLQNRPAWYKEKVYPANKVPSLEHNNEVRGESVDLLKYIDANFDGPSLFPDDQEKQRFAEDLLSFSDEFNMSSFKSFTSSGDLEKDIGLLYDKLEEALSKFNDGPFFLGQFSLVDIAYAPFIERFKPFFAEVRGYDITKGRPKLALWIEELNKLDSYKQTVRDPQELLAALKKKLGIV
ncbi:protein IN2-1 homolog B-like [Wolffia australiana]